MDETIRTKMAIASSTIEAIVDSQDYASLLQRCLANPYKMRFIFSGVGKNWYICEKEVKTFISMGLKASSLDCTHALHGDLGTLMDKDEDKVIVFISKSGKTKEMEKLVDVISDLKASKKIENLTTVGLFLTCDGEYESLKERYDYVLTPRGVSKTLAKVEIDSRDLIPSLSIHTTQLVLDILGVDVFEQCQDLVDNYKYNHLGGNNGKLLGMDKYLDNFGK